MIASDTGDLQCSPFGENTSTKLTTSTSVQSNSNFAEICLMVNNISCGENYNPSYIAHDLRVVQITDTPSSLLNSEIISELCNNKQFCQLTSSNCTNSEYCSCGSLSTLTSPNNVKYISKGIILSPFLSFAFQGINDGDQVYVVFNISQPKKENIKNNDIKSDISLMQKVSQLKACSLVGSIQKLRNRFDQRWAQKFDDPESVFAQIRCASDPRTAAESARIADIYKMRIEEGNSAFRKIQNRFLFANRNEGSTGLTSSRSERLSRIRTILPKKAEKPSSDMLPELWINSSSASFNDYNLSSSV